MNVAYDLKLFSTAALRDTPHAVVELHRDYIKAGCTVVTTASYAVTRFYLRKVNEVDRVCELAMRSVTLAKMARDAEGADEHSILIAGSVPPLGESYQHSGLSRDELKEQYAELISGLAGCDVYLCETMGTVAEGMLAVAMVRAAYPTARIWLSFVPRRADQRESRVASGRVRLSAESCPIGEVVKAALQSGVEALLFNCSTPETVRLAIIEARAALENERMGSRMARRTLRLGGYANSWEEVDTRGWSIEMNESGSGRGDQKAGGFVVRTDLSDELYACKVCEWIAEGASIVGGCCGIGPEAMRCVCEQLRCRGETA